MSIMADYSTLRYEKKGAVAHLILHRPEAGNAVNPQMVAEIREVCSDINQDEHLRAVIVTGSGEAFCLGEDWKELLQQQGKSSGRSPQGSIPDTSVAAEVARIELPVIAAINGNALGTGLALALACDIRIAAEGALLGIPDTPHGCPAASGITQWLPRIVGQARALEMLLLGETIPVQEAWRIGLVHKVLPPQQVLAEAEKLAGEMVPKAPIALKYAKEAVHKGLDLPLEQGLRLECDLYMLLQTTADRYEGIKAFQEKRTPQFKGK